MNRDARHGSTPVAIWSSPRHESAASATQPPLAWVSTGTPGICLPPAASYDFLQVLLTELAERGAPYRAVASNTNFTGTLPIALPGPASASTRWARFTDSDVVLARADLHSRHLSVDQTSVAEENFDAVLTIPSPVPGVAPFRVPRGWSSVDVTVKGFTFRLFNTHLEAFGGETVRNRQAAQLAGAVQRSPHPTVVVGDINSRPPGCSTSTAAFQTLLDAGLQEVWPAVHRRDPCGGFTSGQSPELRNERSRLDHRIDVVLFDPSALSALQTEVIGEEQRDRTQPSGMWPSDHAGAVATLKTRRP